MVWIIGVCMHPLTHPPTGRHDLPHAVYPTVKKGQEPQERVRNLLAKDFFNRAKMEVPGCDRKVKPVAGDIAEENLGISPQLRQELVDNVSVRSISMLSSACAMVCCMGNLAMLFAA